MAGSTGWTTACCETWVSRSMTRRISTRPTRPQSRRSHRRPEAQAFAPGGGRLQAGLASLLEPAHPLLEVDDVGGLGEERFAAGNLLFPEPGIEPIEESDAAGRGVSGYFAGVPFRPRSVQNAVSQCRQDADQASVAYIISL